MLNWKECLSKLLEAKISAISYCDLAPGKFSNSHIFSFIYKHFENHIVYFKDIRPTFLGIKAEVFTILIIS